MAVFLTDPGLASKLAALGVSDLMPEFDSAKRQWPQFMKLMEAAGVVERDEEGGYDVAHLANYEADSTTFAEDQPQLFESIVEDDNPDFASITFVIAASGEIVVIYRGEEIEERARALGFTRASYASGEITRESEPAILPATAQAAAAAADVDVAYRERAMVAPTGDISAKAVLVTIAKHAFGIDRKLEKEDVTLTAVATGEELDKDAIKLTKQLITGAGLDTYKEIATLDNAFKREVDKRAFLTKYRKGTYLLPLSLLDWFEEAREDYVREREGLVRKLLRQWPEIIEEASRRPFFDSTKYPTAEQLAYRFSVDFRYEMPSAPAALEAVRPDLYQQEVARIAQEVNTLGDTVNQMLVAELLDSLTKVRERLEPGATAGGKMRLTPEAVEKLQETLRLLPQRNITDNAELTRLAAELSGVFTPGVDADLLNNNKRIAAEIRTTAKRVEEKLAPMVKPAEGRAFVFRAPKPDEDDEE